jgi:hypothetical protein
MLFGAAAAIGAGLLLARLSSAPKPTTRCPLGADFFVITIAGLAAAFGLIAATLRCSIESRAPTTPVPSDTSSGIQRMNQGRR